MSPLAAYARSPVTVAASSGNTDGGRAVAFRPGDRGPRAPAPSQLRECGEFRHVPAAPARAPLGLDELWLCDSGTEIVATHNPLV